MNSPPASTTVTGRYRTGLPPETVTGRYSHRHRPETKLTKADEFAAGIHHCNGALQSQKNHHKSDGN
ncbi:hypothetical protein ACFX50_07230 [Neisseria meningitidis]